MTQWGGEGDGARNYWDKTMNEHATWLVLLLNGLGGG